MEWIVEPENWIALLTLTTLEVVLGIDNIIFISILTGKLPAERQKKACFVGLSLAMIMRILLLLSLTWLMKLTRPLFSVFGNGISGRDIILIAGGLFLLGKSTFEIHERLEGEQKRSGERLRASFVSIIIQIALLDIVFSLDSVITAIGMANQLVVMIAAIVIAIILMMFSSNWINRAIEAHPTIKMLALAFLLLIGVALIGEGLELHIAKGYIYFAMIFSVFVEILNIRLRRKVSLPVKLRT